MIEGDNVIQRLRSLARVMTQAQAARATGLSPARVSQIADEKGITFLTRPPRPKRSRCASCMFPRDGTRRCLRCKWTPARIKTLRQGLGLSQVDMAFKVLHMNVWAVQRWESGHCRPGRAALVRLERVARSGGTAGAPA
ncbi:hypothetical protein LCGC14_0529020 [marine sediment metagenome]|uniref:Uncharacterized protein n=1 Tax=marine sediment metagenome TaxID=412755 RepID=A0A0F9V471_9ZZZZ